MYLNQKIRKSVFLTIFILVSVCLFPLSAKGHNECHTFVGSSVEEIYENIRISEPLYEWEETIVTFTNEGMTLVNSLVIPITQKKCPIIITLNGFLGDRNDIIVPGTEEQCWKRLSRIMAEQGFASIRIDFRGSGESDGDYSMTTFSTQISDTLTALNYITRKLKYQVDSKSIGIFGFSQGGIVGSTVAAIDRRVDSLVLWSSPSHPPHCYEELLLREGVKQGLALPDGGTISLGLYMSGQYLNWDVTLGKGFFEDLFYINPLAEIRKYNGPMMIVAGQNDILVWPQPLSSQSYLKYHYGYEKLVVLDAGHSFAMEGPEKLDDAIYWTTAWFIKTLGFKK
jgi:pimeloyl-ACP methyl ester carboxylesterase